MHHPHERTHTAFWVRNQACANAVRRCPATNNLFLLFPLFDEACDHMPEQTRHGGSEGSTELDAIASTAEDSARGVHTIGNTCCREPMLLCFTRAWGMSSLRSDARYLEDMLRIATPASPPGSLTSSTACGPMYLQEARPRLPARPLACAQPQLCEDNCLHAPRSTRVNTTTHRNPSDTRRELEMHTSDTGLGTTAPCVGFPRPPARTTTHMMSLWH